MTHFTVLVVARDRDELDEKLAPFDEGTEDEKYLKFVPLEDGEVERRYSEEREEGNYLDCSIEKFVENWYGSHYFLQDGKWGHQTNPNKRWDWYQVGGRWAEWGDVMSKAQVYALRDRRIADSLQDYRKFHEIRKAVTVTEDQVKHWQNFLSETTDRAKFWNEHYNHDAELLAKDEAAFEAVKWYSWGMDDVKLVSLTEEEFINKKCSEALVAAFIDHDGTWHERGRVGWFGYCGDENTNTYNGVEGEFWRFVRSASDEDLFWLVDCHI